MNLNETKIHVLLFILRVSKYGRQCDSREHGLEGSEQCSEMGSEEHSSFRGR